MKIKVNGIRALQFPSRFFPMYDEVDIRKRNGVIEVTPVDENGHFPLSELGRKFDPNRKGIPEDDPLWQLGRNPVRAGITDGSVNHDKYIYGE